MLKVCKYCGRIHEKSYVCEKKPQRKKEDTKQNRFRGTAAWKKKSREIRERDRYLCQVCIRGLYGEGPHYQPACEVHHILPLLNGWEHRLDNETLLTLCTRHHKAAEYGEIPKEALLFIAREQEERQA